jgi:hypothetical protein
MLTFKNMSRFRIYQIDYFDPKIAGQNVRRQIIMYSILDFILVLIFAVFISLLKMNMILLLVIFIPLLGFNIYLFQKLGSKLKHTKTIGEIEFTRTCIKKRIGDSLAELDYKTIKKIELQKHFPTVETSGTLYDNFTFILKIIFFNSSSESLVVSNLPIDNRQNISIVETMKTLRKIIELEITIET